MAIKRMKSRPSMVGGPIQPPSQIRVSDLLKLPDLDGYARVTVAPRRKYVTYFDYDEECQKRIKIWQMEVESVELEPTFRAGTPGEKGTVITRTGSEHGAYNFYWVDGKWRLSVSGK